MKSKKSFNCAVKTAVAHRTLVTTQQLLTEENQQWNKCFLHFLYEPDPWGLFTAEKVRCDTNTIF